MQWGFPYAFLFLLGAIPLILFLHSLRLRGTQVKTTALFIWERVLKERPMGKRLGWLLRKNLLLMLQILAALLLIAALADPSLLRFGTAEGDIVVVMDLSASMKARGNDGSRFENAQKELLTLIEAMGSDQKMMLIGAGPIPRILTPFTADQAKLEELASGLQATDAPAPVREAVLFAHSFLKRGSPDKIVAISDGAFDGAQDFPWQSAHLRLIQVVGGKENVGIVGFEVRRLPQQASRYEIMLHIRNFTGRPVRAPLTVALGEKTLVREPIEIEAYERSVLIYPYEGPLTGRAEARLEIEDDFATDNRAYLVLSDAPPIRVLYAGEGNPFLENLLRLFPYVHVTTAQTWPAESSVEQRNGYDVVILDGISSPPLSEGKFILINTVPQGLPLRASGKINAPRIQPSATREGLGEGLRLDDLYVEEALRLLPKEQGTVLARAREGPLIVALDKGRLKALVIAFDLLASDLPFRVAFPVLFSNAFEWLRPQRAEFPADKARAGAPHPLRLSGGGDEIEIQTPSGKSENLRVIADPLIFADTFETGFYQFKSGGRTGEFTVNLFSENESFITSRVESAVQLGPDNQAQPEHRAEAGFSLWPFLLIAGLILLGVELFLAFREGLSFYPLAIRVLAYSALILALVNPKIYQAITALDVMLGVDFSRSVGQEAKTKAARILEEAARLDDPRTRTGLFFFGKQPIWEFLPRSDVPIADFSPQVVREETDLQAALQAAAAQVSEGRQGRVLLISDGNENRGEVSRVLPLLRSQKAQVWVLPVTLFQGRNEIYLSDLSSPRQVDSAESFEVKGAIESLTEAPARVKLLRDGVVQSERVLMLSRGTNWVSFKQSLKERGIHTFELLVESPEDTLPENNLLSGVVEVKGPPRVLYLYSEKQSQRFLSRVLQVQGYNVVEGSPESSSLSLAEISAFDLVVLDNVPAYQLAHGKMEALEKYVRDLGGGLLVIGGSQSYGAGGYYRTPMERVLPVDMRPPARLDLPHVALLFVLDKSGSMGGGPEGSTKLDLAKAAAMAAADIMNPSDQVGILAFDAEWDWVLPFRQVGKGEWISERLSGLQSDGGTDLYKAMLEAHRSFASKEAAIKHVLVLSDGLTDKKDFRSVVESMARGGITVSTVSVGQDADFGLMGEIAKGGKGRAYVTVDPRTIPQIFTTETLLISRDLLVEKLVQPKIMVAAGPLKGFSQKNLPPLRGYIVTHPKPRSDLLMKVDDDPLLASWRYGLGKVVAFTSDLSGRWGKDWLNWEGLPQWAGQLARSTMRRMSEEFVRTEIQPEGEEVGVVADLLSKDGKYLNHLKLKGNFTAPDRTTAEGNFQQIAPGRYEGRFSAEQRGVHLLTIYAEGKKGEEPVPVATVPHIKPYPREYRELKPNMALLSRLTEESGGQVLDPERMEEGIKKLFTPDPGKATVAQETWWPLSGLGLFLFLADLAARRWPRKSVPIR